MQYRKTYLIILLLEISHMIPSGYDYVSWRKRITPRVHKGFTDIFLCFLQTDAVIGYWKCVPNGAGPCRSSVHISKERSNQCVVGYRKRDT